MNDMKQELRILVDNGCLVRDVIVEHPIYGQLVGQLDISSRHDVDEFISQVSQSDAAPLSDLTGGIHLHTIICPDKETYDRVLEQARFHFRRSQLRLGGQVLTKYLLSLIIHTMCQDTCQPVCLQV